ncbi:AfsR/SARP family transcriptional regulator [Sphaerisporangium sp. TRM90804]|nr:AfsR/SARP family transcriptional regulator [Sphaerisporangium sp. TRM90804]MDH2429620.1 AfsR/SARP family transcriptional regulator [Sphaerisporangium sp. TRM90804]
MIEFRALGALEIRTDIRVCTPTAPRVRQILALLLMRANQVVPLDLIIEELWDDSPPKTAVTTVQTYIYRLRTNILRKTMGTAGHAMLPTMAQGYLLRVEHGALDTEVFRRLVTRGRVHLEQGRHDEAAHDLRDALAMWSGPPLANVRLGPLLQTHVALLEEDRLRARELRISADLMLGRHRELIGELRSLVAAHPLNEWLHGQLITALGRAGRRSEALQAYQNLRIILKRELGLEPSAEAERLQAEVLRAAGHAGRTDVPLSIR